MISKILLASVAIILILATATADEDYSQYCPLVPVGTKFASLYSCQDYITCQSTSLGIPASCPNNQVFSKNAQTCVPAGSINCEVDPDNPCLNMNGVWVADSNDCRIWHYCVNGQIEGTGSCGAGQVFDFRTQSCRNGICPSNGSGNNTTINNLCPIMQDDQFFGDFNNCKVWHKCNGLTLKSGTCGDGLIYDAQQRMCIFSKDNTCGGPTQVCNADNAGQKVGDSNICSNYFVCTKQYTNWLWQKKTCINNNYFNPGTNSCLSRQAATPVSTCDRCQYSPSQWVNAVDPNCKNYLICKNGITIQSGTCKTGYFNEQMQICAQGSSLKSYIQSNGACATPSESTTETPTEKPTDPPTEKPTDPETEKPTDAPTEKPTDPETEKPTDAPTEKPTDPETEKPTDLETEKPTDTEAVAPDS